MDPKDMPTPLPSLMLGGALWALRPDAIPRVLEFARIVARSGGTPPAAAAAALVEQPSPAGPGVAVIPLTGVLTPHGSFLSYLFGGGAGGVQGFRDQLARAVADPE